MNIRCDLCQGEMALESGSMACGVCKTVRAESMPDEDELAIFYEAFLENYHGGGRSISAVKRQKAWARTYLRTIKPYIDQGTLCDVGPANSPFPLLTHDDGIITTVVDFTRPDFGGRTIDYHRYSLNQPHSLKNIGKQFDCITAWAVLEHCTEAGVAINNLVSACKSGGYIILSTPAGGRICDQIAAGRTPWFYPPEHLYVLSSIGIQRRFENEGCILIKKSYIEISWIRTVARSFVRFFESVLGYMLMLLSKRLWSRLRMKRTHFAADVMVYVFRKSVPSNDAILN